MSYQKIEYEIADDVAMIRLNDPATLNAMSAAMGEELLDATRRAGEEARALLIGSVGRAFCSGANLTDDGVDLDDPMRDAGEPLERLFNPQILAMRASKIPIVSAVRGAAAGVGCGIALAADMIVASYTGYFFQAFRHVGLAADGGSSFLLAKAIGRVRAMELMLLGTKLPAATALEWGLINRVVPDAELDAHALGLAAELARGPRSIGFIRAAAWAALELPLEDALALERSYQRDASRTEDFVEGVAAFRDRRPAMFKGR